MDIMNKNFLDITAPDNVEVEIQNRVNGKVLYVHVDGMTVLRICQIKNEIALSEADEYA